MERLTFRLQVISPLFLSGADQKVGELRPPSIRGALRFWFRAMMGGVVEGDWQKVQKLEALVLGNTEQASPVQLRCKEERPQWYAMGKEVGRLPEGVLYLGFNLFRRGRRPNPDTLERPCIWPSSKDQADFQIQFFFNREEPILRDVVLGAFWLLLHCGGLGARTRRGFGGLRLLKPTDGEHPLFQEQCPRDGSGKFFHEHLAQIAESYAKFAQNHGIPANPREIFTSSPNMPSFSCFARYQGLVLQPSQGPWESWEEALSGLGQALRNFRLDSQAKSRFGATHDYPVIANFLDNKLSAAEMKDLRYDGFGLPIQYRSWSRTERDQERIKQEALNQGLNKEQAEKEARKIQVRAILQAERATKGGQESLDRRASPLFVRPLRFQGGTYGGLLLFFEAQFLPQGAREVLRPIKAGWPPSRPEPKPVPVEIGDLKVVHEFLKMLEKKTDYKIEVWS